MLLRSLMFILFIAFIFFNLFASAMGDGWVERSGGEKYKKMEGQSFQFVLSLYVSVHLMLLQIKIVTF